MKYFLPILILILLVFSCKKNDKLATVTPQEEVVKEKIIKKFGFALNDYKVVEDTIKNGESFGEILGRNHLETGEIYKVAESAKKDSFDVRRLRAGKPYTILASKDTLEKAQVFIYQPSKVEYVVVDLRDSVAKTLVKKKQIKTVTKSATGIITSSLSQTMNDQGLDYNLVNEMSEIYAWTVDFFHIQKGDNFKIIYEEKFVDDTTYVGIGEIKAAYFEHKDNPLYAFKYVTDSTKNIADYYDDKAGNLRRQFLKAPVSFKNVRISSRYNLKRRIAHYGYKVKPHKGTDFAAPHGTPIIATASGTVTKSSYGRGNGKYVKIKHNATYSTQYLHMSRRKAKVGDYVKQGDVIGYVGNTGSSAGNHVCYRFWKNGKQVDPFKQKLPSAAPIKEELKNGFLQYIQPYKSRLDAMEVMTPDLLAKSSDPIFEQN